MAAKSGVAVFSVSVPQAATDWLSVRLGVFVRECVCVSSCGRTRNERETALSPSLYLPPLPDDKHRARGFTNDAAATDEGERRW